MPTLAWNEIRNKALAFSREWHDETSERSEAQTFWNEFFEVFGLRRRTIASFEEPVKSIRGTWARIDLFWKGTLLAEHKSAGSDFDRASCQAFDYIQSLARDGRHDEIPRYVVVSDFARFAFFDLEAESQADYPIVFPLDELHQRIRLFAFIAGYKIDTGTREEDPVSLEATRIMAGIHDALEASGYEGADLERFLVRILFCMFAEDTGIFEPAQFQLLLENHSRPDGADTGGLLAQLFDVLNTSLECRQRNLDEDLNAFPYVNGALFADRIRVVAFDAAMRDQLLSACHFRWSEISPSIFGSLFQGILKSPERRQLGAHYTSERDILKVIRPLFLDTIEAEVSAAIDDRSTRREARIKETQLRLASLNFFDPACGCGNFLAISYRELRRQELRLLLELHRNSTTQLGLGELAKLSLVDVNQFYGIEILEWPARIAELALWLTDHQMNVEMGLAFGNLIQRIPLRAAPHIVHGNALRIDWENVLPRSRCNYILGNPPFVGKKERDPGQREDHNLVWHGRPSAGLLDYVTCWYLKAARYVKGSTIRCAFVSTNSITQGEQVGLLWEALLDEHQIHIQFAHRTFGWKSDARRPAHVHVVIIGFGCEKLDTCELFEYDSPTGEPHRIHVSEISPYLIEGKPIYLNNRTAPLSASTPETNYGSFALDDGAFTLSREERDEIISECPAAEPYIKPFIGARELIHSLERYCIWLIDAPPAAITACGHLKQRVEHVREWRLSRDRQTTRNLAQTPHLFAEVRQPQTPYLALPTASSETRQYIPIAFLSPEVIASNQVYVVPNATHWHFGVLTSAMHMAWIDAIAGRIKSDYRYSARLVYNNFPWPEDVSESLIARVNATAEKVLEARSRYEQSTLGELYNPVAMPRPLYEAHRMLDAAVDACYRRARFRSARERVEYLMELYAQRTMPTALAAEH